MTACAWMTIRISCKSEHDLQTSPVLACRKEVPIENVRGTVGTAIPETSIRVVDADTLEDLPDGEKGLLLAKGPGIMRGYYNDKESTDKAMRAGNGWFDTGDIGWRAPGAALTSSFLIVTSDFTSRFRGEA